MASVSTPLAMRGLFLEAQGTDPPLYYTAAEYRYLASGVWTSAGVLQREGFKISQGPDLVGQPWAITVAAGHALVDYAGSNQRFLLRSVGDVVIDLAGKINTAPTATRTHAVYLVVWDTAGHYGAEYLVSEDVGAGAPVPSGVAGYLKIGSFTIASGQANIKDVNIANLFPPATFGHDRTPQASALLAQPNWGGVIPPGFNAFTAAQWPPVTFSLPVSRQAYVTIGAHMHGPGGGASGDYYAVGYRFSINPTYSGLSYSDSRGAVMAEAGIRVAASKRLLLQWPASANSVTVTPSYWIPSSPYVGMDLLYGQLIVEPVG